MSNPSGQHSDNRAVIEAIRDTDVKTLRWIASHGEPQFYHQLREIADRLKGLRLGFMTGAKEFPIDWDDFG